MSAPAATSLSAASLFSTITHSCSGVRWNLTTQVAFMDPINQFLQVPRLPRQEISKVQATCLWSSRVLQPSPVAQQCMACPRLAWCKPCEELCSHCCRQCLHQLHARPAQQQRQGWHLLLQHAVQFDQVWQLCRGIHHIAIG